MFSPITKGFISLGLIGIVGTTATLTIFTLRDGDKRTSEQVKRDNVAKEECGDSNTSVWTISYTSSSGITTPVINNKESKNNKNKTYDEWKQCREKHYPATQTADNA